MPTKTELVKELQNKVKSAKPTVKKFGFSTKHLMRLPKKELERQIKHAKVVKSGEYKGDVNLR